MIRFLLIAVLVLAVISAAAIFIATLGWKRAQKAEKENKALHEAFWQVKEKAGRLQQALGENAKVEEEANVERKELARTADTGLAGRANRLFLQDNGKGKPAGNAGPAQAAGSAGAGYGTGTV
jgi:Flp pilus assembly protein TadB